MSNKRKIWFGAAIAAAIGLIAISSGVIDFPTERRQHGRDDHARAALSRTAELGGRRQARRTGESDHAADGPRTGGRRGEGRGSRAPPEASRQRIAAKQSAEAAAQAIGKVAAKQSARSPRKQSAQGRRASNRRKVAAKQSAAAKQRPAAGNAEGRRQTRPGRREAMRRRPPRTQSAQGRREATAKAPRRRQRRTPPSNAARSPPERSRHKLLQAAARRKLPRRTQPRTRRKTHGRSSRSPPFSALEPPASMPAVCFWSVRVIYAAPGKTSWGETECGAASRACFWHGCRSQPLLKKACSGCRTSRPTDRQGSSGSSRSATLCHTRCARSRTRSRGSAGCSAGFLPSQRSSC